MGRQGGNSMAASGGDGSASSIALLQERFRQLQKMREKRQEMELLKLFPGPESLSQTNRYEPQVTLLMHPEMNLHSTTTASTRACFQDSLSLGLNLHTEKAKPRKPAKEPPFKDFWSANSNEVDTSLRL